MRRYVTPKKSQTRVSSARSQAASRQWPSLSVIIPVYNEEKTIAEIIGRVRAVPIPKEIIVVDDASTDKTVERLQALKGRDLRVVRHPVNSGKGAALHVIYPSARHVPTKVSLFRDFLARRCAETMVD